MIIWQSSRTSTGHSAGKLEEIRLYIEDDFQASFNAFGQPGLYKNVLSYHAWGHISSDKELVEGLKRDLADGPRTSA